MNDGRGTHTPIAEAAGTPAASREIRSTRRPYVAPRVERRIPVASNTLQTTSGNQNVFPGDE